MPDDARERLQSAQDALVEALLGGRPAPPGFEASEIERARSVLAHKRAWVDARRARSQKPRLSRWRGLVARALRRISGGHD